MPECLAEDTVLDLLAGRLDASARDAVTVHLDTCPACRELVADVARDPDAELGGPLMGAPLRRGANVGRYVVIDPVGVGSMGAVYAAYDPELDRKVALKLLRAGALDHAASEGLGPRLQREAQALARLSHPNVVTVHDVGNFGDGIFIAMELVEGGTLASFLHEARRPVRQIVEMFCQAGEGLAAAHAAGIVHRDFKPANVMLGRDGRVRVGDFGLARASVGAPPALPGAGVDSGATAATKTGALVGTPAYMAPEQWEGEPTDARTDVFGFSVALYEALHGSRPFAGETRAELLAAILRHEVRPAPEGARVPAPLRRILLRGLRADPAERYPSMRVMLDALEARPRTLRVAALLGAGILSLALLAFGLRRPPPLPVCVGAEAAWGDVFSPAFESAVHRAFAGTGSKSAEFAFGTVKRTLGDYRRAWIAMHRDACEATHVRHAQSDAMLDLRMVCLESRRRDAAALVSVLSAADEKTVLDTPAVLGSLPRVSACAETPSLLAPDPPPSDPAERAELVRLDAEITRARALHKAARAGPCLEVLGPLLPAVQALDHRPVSARYHLALGLCELVGTGAQKKTAATALHEAARLAVLSRDDATAADAWTALMTVRGPYWDRADEAERWGRYAEAAIARAGGDDAREAACQRGFAGIALFLRDQPEESQRFAERARSLWEKAGGPDDYHLAEADLFIAGGLVGRDLQEEALAVFRRERAQRERTLGPDHPSLAVTLENEGMVLTSLGRPDEALPLFRSVLSRWPEKAALGGHLQFEMAMALRRKHAYREALALDRESFDLQEKDVAHRHETPWSLTGMGLDHLGLGEPREAVPLLERAVAGGLEIEGARFALARALWDSGGDRERARRVAEEALPELREHAVRYGGRFRRAVDEIEAWLATRR